jgi:signal transduction histidine kinase
MTAGAGVAGFQPSVVSDFGAEPFILGALLVGAGAAALLSVMFSWRRKVLNASRTIDRLEQAILSRDAYLNSVSRNLRTPLAAVLGLARELYADWRSFSVEDRTELMAIIAEQSSAIALVVDDMLVVARGDPATLEVEQEPLDTVEIAAEVAATVGRTNHHQIEVRGQGGVVIADRSRVRQILHSLLSNAIHHGGPNVWIEVRDTVDAVALSICDDGPGIEDEVVGRVFDLPVDRSNPIPEGLGLPVARQLAQRMGGDLSYWKRPHAACVVLTLPRAVRLAAAG